MSGSRAARGEPTQGRVHDLAVGLSHPVLIVRYIQYKLRLIPYSEFYAAFMRYRVAKDPREAVGGLWDQIGPLQLKTLQSQGLLPVHTLLDYGCGTLRAGRLFIEYLDSGNYFGVDISEEAIRAGLNLLGPETVSKKKPRFKAVKGTSLEGLGERFDFIVAQSVFTHMPTPDIVSLFGHLREVMKPSTKLLATYWDSSEHDGTIVDFTQPLDFFKRLGFEHGLSVEIVPGFAHPRSQKLLLIRSAA